MDQTSPRGYPYPECEPPLTQDAADIAHLRNLAMAVDADVEALDDIATDNIIKPVGCVLTTFAAASFDPFTRILWTGTNFVSEPGQNEQGGLRVVRDGTYMVTASVNSAVEVPGGDTMKLRVSIDGGQDVDFPGLGVGMATTYSGTLRTGVNGSSVQRLTVGQRLQLYVQTQTLASVTVDQAYFGFVRLGGL